MCNGGRDKEVGMSPGYEKESVGCKVERGHGYGKGVGISFKLGGIT